MAASSVTLRPARAALRLAVAISALALAAVNYESNTSWLIATLILGLATVSALQARRNLQGVQVVSQPITPIFAEDPFPIPVQIKTSVAPAFSLLVTVDGAQAGALRVDAGHEHPLQVVHRGLARGRHTLSAPILSSRFPFGLIEARTAAESSVSVLVYPRPDGIPLSSKAGEDGGDGEGSGPGEGDDFAGHRDWQPGDSQRRIDWRAVARGRPLLIKQFSGSSVECRLQWDSTTGGTEARLSQLARWVIDADTQGWRFALHLPGIEIPGGTGIPHRQRCLEALALYRDRSLLS